MTHLTQWLEYRFHTARVIGSNPIVGKTYLLQLSNKSEQISFTLF